MALTSTEIVKSAQLTCIFLECKVIVSNVLAWRLVIIPINSGMSGFVVAMHSGLGEQYVESETSVLGIVVCLHSVHCDNNPFPTSLNPLIYMIYGYIVLYCVSLVGGTPERPFSARIYFYYNNETWIWYQSTFVW